MDNTLEIIRGDTTSFEVTMKETDGTPYNLTGYTVFFTLKRRLSDTDAEALLKKDVTSHVDAVNGITTIAFTPEETASLDPNRIDKPYKWDLQLKGADGTILSTTVGDCVVYADVTKRTG